MKVFGLLGSGLVLCGMLIACDPAQRAGKEALIFEDTIPCADCPGIIMNVRLDTSDQTYARNMTYLEATAAGNDTTFTTTGPFRTEKGYKGNDQSLLYVLEGSPSGGEQVFLAEGDSAITALDGNREIIRSELNFTLRRTE